jgi:hypothetical protein
VDNHGTLHADAAEPVPQWLVVPTDTAVRHMLRAVARGKSEVIVTGHGKVLVAMERFLPWLSRAVKRRLAARGGYRSEPRTD